MRGRSLGRNQGRGEKSKAAAEIEGEMDDPLVEMYTESELKIVAEFLLNWKPFLTRDLCPACSRSLTNRIHSLDPGDVDVEPDGGGVVHEDEVAAVAAETSMTTEAVTPPRGKVSWVDMMQEDELDQEEGRGESGGVVENKALRVEAGSKGKGKKVQLSRDKRESKRCMAVVRKKDFICLERVNGRIQNVLDGLELHTSVFNMAEQNKIVGFIYGLQEKGRKGELGDQSYCEPAKWMHGKGRVMIQFGCCYDYAMDKGEHSPGILQNTVASPLPPLLKMIIKRIVRWHVLPPSCVPDGCIINIYESGDYMPPHIYSHDFIRPFCTLSFLSECHMVFGTNIQSNDTGKFAGSATIPLPVGSVLVFNGNGADLAKHAIPAVPTKRISITFWKTDESKQPISFKQEQDLHDIQPLPHGHNAVLKTAEADVPRRSVDTRVMGRVKEYVGRSPDFRSERDSQGQSVMHMREIGNSSNRSYGQISKKSIDSGGSDGSVGRVAEHKSSSVNSQGISSPRDDGRPCILGTPKRQVAPPLRVVCMDERRIVVCSDTREVSPDNTPLEMVDSETSVDSNHRRRYMARSRRR